MGTLTGTQLNTRALVELNDTDATRWTTANALLWLNDGIRAVCLKRPAAHTEHIAFTLGATCRQNIQTAHPRAFAVLDVPYNLSGGAPGLSIRKAEVADMDLIEPAWRTKSGSDVRHWLPDAEPHGFFVYPGTPKTGVTRSVELVAATLPDEMTSLAAVIPIDDVYANALVHYLLFRSYAMDAEYAASASASAAYLQLFNADLET